MSDLALFSKLCVYDTKYQIHALLSPSVALIMMLPAQYLSPPIPETFVFISQEHARLSRSQKGTVSPTKELN